MDLLTSPDEIAAIQKQYQEIGYQFCTSLDELLPALDGQSNRLYGTDRCWKINIAKQDCS